MQAGVDTSNFAKEADLACLKWEVDQSDIDKLKNVPSVWKVKQINQMLIN